MNIKIEPRFLEGELTLPPSKSISNRVLICSALAKGASSISNLLYCNDTKTLILALTALGAKVRQTGKLVSVTGISTIPEEVTINCKDSTCTIRFIIPLVAALCKDVTLVTENKLSRKLISSYFELLKEHGITIQNDKYPFRFTGKLLPGKYKLPNNISSQFLSGLLFALPLLDGDSEIIFDEPLEPNIYTNMTLYCQRKNEVSVHETETGFIITGNQKYKQSSFSIEADMSNAAFFLISNYFGSDVYLNNVSQNSIQSDKIIFDIVDNFKINKVLDINISKFPDLLVPLVMIACFGKENSYIRNCDALKHKDYVRLEQLIDTLNSLGAKLTLKNNVLTVQCVESLEGGTCDSCNDHRIVMALAIISQKCTSAITIQNAECIIRSYPTFFDDFTTLGGKAVVQNCEVVPTAECMTQDENM